MRNLNKIQLTPMKQIRENLNKFLHYINDKKICANVIRSYKNYSENENFNNYQYSIVFNDVNFISEFKLCFKYDNDVKNSLINIVIINNKNELFFSDNLSVKQTNELLKKLFNKIKNNDEVIFIDEIVKHAYELFIPDLTKKRYEYFIKLKNEKNEKISNENLIKSQEIEKKLIKKTNYLNKIEELILKHQKDVNKSVFNSFVNKKEKLIDEINVCENDLKKSKSLCLYPVSYFYWHNYR